MVGGDGVGGGERAAPEDVDVARGGPSLGMQGRQRADGPEPHARRGLLDAAVAKAFGGRKKLLAM